MSVTDTGTTDTARLPGYAPALIALAGFLAARPQLPEPENVQVRIHPRTGRRRVQVCLRQGAGSLDSEHAVTAWALALGGAHAVVTDHPEGAEPWTHYCAEGYADALKIRVVICHIHPAAAKA